MDKQSFRAALINKRIRLDKAEKSVSDDVIFQRILHLDSFKKCECLLSYVSTDTEVDTKRIIEYALKHGKTVAVPKCERKSNIMRFYRINSLSNLEKGYFSILEPDRFCSELTEFENAFCIVPGLAFNNNGFRLGFGRGYYDRFLSENKVFSVGICYKDFVLDNLPVESFDRAVDLLITD